MKKSGFFAASLAAASATALSASSPSPSPAFFCDSAGNHCSHQEEGNNAENSSARRSSSTEKFAPKFDGLRFIETLVTAHR